MKRLFITTTNDIDNGKAVEYYGVVSSHIVAGTGFLSDFAASVSDIFGGRSGSYRRQLEGLYDEALDELSDKAHLLGANSILGLKIDMDNISGKGMSMFMITAVGTAAKVEFDAEEQAVGSLDSVTSAVLVNEIAKRAILAELDDDKSYFQQEDWGPILKCPDNDYVLPLSRWFFKVVTQPGMYEFGYVEAFKKNYGQFIQMVDRDLVVQGVYEGMKLEGGFDAARALVNEYSLFDARSLLALIKEGYTNRAVAVLGAEQPSYTETDLHDMEALVYALENLPDVGKKEVVKGGMFSKDGEKYICAHGHKNYPDVEFCVDCGENIKGLDRSGLKAVEVFKNRVAVLKDLLAE